MQLSTRTLPFVLQGTMCTRVVLDWNIVESEREFSSTGNMIDAFCVKSHRKSMLVFFCLFFVIVVVVLGVFLGGGFGFLVFCSDDFSGLSFWEHEETCLSHIRKCSTQKYHMSSHPALCG